LYQYEAFLSYRRGAIHSQWLRKHFIPLFRDRLIEEVAEHCNRDACELFHDVDEVLPGMNVPDRVVNGLRGARCLVALVSPSYFRSPWCLVEWESFRTRSQNEACDLIIPVILSAGSTVQSQVGNTMCADFSDYTIVGPAFTNTNLYVQFQIEIKKLARRVANIIAKAPDWKDFEICNPPRYQFAGPTPILKVGL